MSKDKKSNRRFQSVIQLGLFIGIILFINILANVRFGNMALYTTLDLTEEGRFTLTEGTRNLLQDLDEVVYVNILLEGDFPAGFKRLQRSTQEVLDDFRGESGLIEYAFEDPAQGTIQEINDRRKKLAEIGVIPVQVSIYDKQEASKKVIYPFAILYYKGRSISVNLLENETPGVPPEVTLNQSIALLEYKMANAIQKLQQDVNRPIIMYTSGHGELGQPETADLDRTLNAFYNLGRLNLDSIVSISDEVSALIVAKPRGSFTEKDKFKIDQYVMRGGKVLWMIDRMRADLDSLLGRREYLAVEYSEDNFNLEDLLFRYGVRMEPNLLLDMRNSKIELAVGKVGNSAQFEKFAYPYHPILVPKNDHPIVKSLGPVNVFYPSTIDTAVRTKTAVDKTVLLETSEYTRYQLTPVALDFNFLRYPLDPKKFNQKPQPVAVLMEGIFPSMYENRVSEEMLSGLEELGETFNTKSEPTRMIVVSDGDLAKDPIVPGRQEYFPLGYNRFENFTFANKDFIVNAIEYLLDDNGVIEARAKEVKLRLLDVVRAEKEQTYWQFFNIGLPLLFLGIFGAAYTFWRRRKYAQ
ncbi:MAG: gliding motility-associated ABC transporter substrate-binding protein GldG [Saprospiraceae bacterium]|nr:gliding motility-associated ABC transporter substrate-binding protein GldG [Saprospiraceae bacterium]